MEHMWQRGWFYRFAVFLNNSCKLKPLRKCRQPVTTGHFWHVHVCSMSCLASVLGEQGLVGSSGRQWGNHLHENLRYFHLASIFPNMGQKVCPGLCIGFSSHPNIWHRLTLCLDDLGQGGKRHLLWSLLCGHMQRLLMYWKFPPWNPAADRSSGLSNAETFP